jgi:fumarate reductase subunit D
MNSKKILIPYVILIAGLILLILNLVASDLDSDKMVGFYCRIASNILLIVSMLVVIKNRKKTKP